MVEDLQTVGVRMHHISVCFGSSVRVERDEDAVRNECRNAPLIPRSYRVPQKDWAATSEACSREVALDFPAYPHGLHVRTKERCLGSGSPLELAPVPGACGA